MEKGISQLEALKAVKFISSHIFTSVLLNTFLILSFRACFVSPLTLVLIMLSFAYFERDTFSFTTVAENVAWICK